MDDGFGGLLLVFLLSSALSIIYFVLDSKHEIKMRELDIEEKRIESKKKKKKSKKDEEDEED